VVVQQRTEEEQAAMPPDGINFRGINYNVKQLKERSESNQRKDLEDIRARVKLSSSSAAAVSCVCYSFLNCHGQLRCAEFSRDASHVVAGFSDSSIRWIEAPIQS
jgi:hypothetical protein